VANELDRLRGEVGEIVAKHDATKGLVNFTKYADDPVGFLRDVLKCDPWSAQVEMAERVRDHPQVCIVSANSIGKDWLISRLCLWHVYARRGLAILTSVTDRQVRNISMKEVRRAFLSTPSLPGELFQMELRVDDESGIVAFTSDHVERLVGWHHPRLLLCLSEGQGLEPDVFEAAHACATGAENAIVCYGNPTRPTGPFHDAATSDNWDTLTVPASAHPNIISGREEIPGGPSVAWIASMAEEYGRDSSIFRARVLSEWPTESVEGLIKKSWLLAAYARHGDDPGLQHRPVLGFDVARYGPDSSVVAVARGGHVRELVTWHGASITDSVEKVLAVAKRVRREWLLLFDSPDMVDCGISTAPLSTAPLPTVVVDVIGLGAGAADLLRLRRQPVEEFNASARAFDPARFLNARSESFWHFRTMLEDGTVALPRDAELEEECLVVEWSINAAGKIQILSKDTMRATLGRSCDKLDAVVMALARSVPDPRRAWTQFTPVW
jgi:hypothetical protein